MQRRQALKGIAAAGAAALPVSAADEDFTALVRADFLRHWDDTKTYTLAMIEAMPEEHFDFQPTEQQRPFAWQAIHIGRANVGYYRSFQKELGPPEPSFPDGAPTDKRAVIDFVAASFDYTRAVLASLTPEDLQRRDLEISPRHRTHAATDIFLRGYMHSAHHRGQLAVYLRLKGITPATWTFAPVGREEQ